MPVRTGTAAHRLEQARALDGLHDRPEVAVVGTRSRNHRPPGHGSILIGSFSPYGLVVRAHLFEQRVERGVERGPH